MPHGFLTDKQNLILTSESVSNQSVSGTLKDYGHTIQGNKSVLTIVSPNFLKKEFSAPAVILLPAKVDPYLVMVVPERVQEVTNALSLKYKFQKRYEAAPIHL